MSSTSFGSSNSSNTSFIPNYPQSDILMQIAQMASQIGQQQYQWAQGQFAKTSQVTDQAVGNYLDASNMAKSLASNNLDRYTNLFQPEENQLVDDANTYASDARVRSEMGAAESGVGQSFDAARKNREQQLQSFGIDPSSGRYAELDRADDAARAAAQAGAGQAARYNTEATARQLRSQAIQVGQQYPGQIVNTLNAQANDLAGMQNASLGNANTGANLFNSADAWLNTANGLKYPPLGTQGGSSSYQNSQSSTPPRSGSSGSGGGGTGGGSGTGGFSNGSPGYDPNLSAYQANPKFYGPSGPSITQVPGGGVGGSDTGNYDQFAMGDPSAGENNWSWMDPSNNNFGGGYSAPSLGFTPTDGGFDYSAPASQYTNDMSAGSGGFGGSDYQPDYSAYDTSNSGGGFGAADSGGGDWSGYDFAAGGAIPDAGQTSGGFVNQSLSPSQGQQTDDIPARLNANEFVIPRDVAMWKGQEFFQKLIDQSRKARGAAPAQGKPAPAPQGAPRFVSQGA